MLISKVKIQITLKIYVRVDCHAIIEKWKISFIKYQYYLGGGNGNPLQYSCLGNSMDRGAWRATIHGVIESDMI